MKPFLILTKHGSVFLVIDRLEGGREPLFLLVDEDGLIFQSHLGEERFIAFAPPNATRQTIVEWRQWLT